MNTKKHNLFGCFTSDWNVFWNNKPWDFNYNFNFFRVSLIDELEFEIETRVGERGVQLSGGQK